MNVGLFGGSFNPPHQAHAEVLQYLVQKSDEPKFDEIWLIPTHLHAFTKKLLPFAVRMDLLRLMKEDLCLSEEEKTSIQILDIEAHLPGKNRTIDTVQALKKKFPQHSFWVVLGSDLQREIPQWKDFEKLKSIVPFFFIPRKGFDPEKQGTRPATPIAAEISSSEIRQALKKELPITHLVTAGIATYLQKNREKILEYLK